MALGGLELLGILLRLGQRLQVVLELVANGAFDSLEPDPLEDQREARPDLHPLDDLVLGRFHRQRRAELLDDLLHPRPAPPGPPPPGPPPPPVARLAPRSGERRGGEKGRTPGAA